MERKLVTDMDSWASLEPDERNVIADPYSIDYDAELEMDRWLEEQAREARQLREDAEAEIWNASQLYGDPVPEDTFKAAVDNLIIAHYAAQHAGTAEAADVFSDYGATAWKALSAALPKQLTSAAVATPSLSARAGQQGRRSSRTRRSASARRARAPGRSDDPDLPLDRPVRRRGLPRSGGAS